MDDKTRNLIRYVCDGDIRKSQQQARIVLENLSSKKDELFQKNMIRKLEAKQSNFIELPNNLRDLLIAEDSANFPESRFILRPDESAVVEKMMATLAAANELAELGISHVPTLMLYGCSGNGKTMLARYVAYKVGLPFVYVRFSSMVSSHLGSTQSNIAKVFEYARTAPCVLCFDEIDAVGMARGQRNDVGEMNRIVISLMQELDSIPNNVIIIGTTNRYDRMDEALLRRFTIRHEVTILAGNDVMNLAEKFFTYAGYDTNGWLLDFCQKNFAENEPASTVIEKCTQKIVADIMERYERKA